MGTRMRPVYVPWWSRTGSDACDDELRRDLDERADLGQISPSASGTGLYVAVQAFGALIGFLIGAYLADAIGRKWTFMISAIATIIMVLVYLYVPVGDTGLLLLGIPARRSRCSRLWPMR
jgi:MFS family permease